MKINWEDSESHLLLNPRIQYSYDFSLPDFQNQLFNWPAHIWISSSGTTTVNRLKLVGLSKTAILFSADAVNRFVHSDEKDIWLNVLPEFHIGGLSIFARAYLSGAKVVSHHSKWSVPQFKEICESEKVTLTSLVPTQILDLVRQGISSPNSLRAVFVGGDFLSRNLYERARELGWPLLPTFGLSECASQVATASLESLNVKEFPLLTVLKHVKTELSETGKLHLKSQSLLTAYLIIENGKAKLIDPKKNGWFETDDLVEINGTLLKPLGRGTDFVKVGAEGVYLSSLRERWQSELLRLGILVDAEIIAVPDERLGYRIEAVTNGQDINLEKAVEAFNEKVAPFERIKNLTVTRQLERNELGKMKLSAQQ